VTHSIIARRLAAAAACALLALAAPQAARAQDSQQAAAAQAGITLASQHFNSEFVQAFLNNEFLLENIRLIGLAEDSYALGLFDVAFDYAQEAIRFARLSDEYVAMQIRIREADEAISSARFRLEQADRAGAPTLHAEIYESAQEAFEGALAARERGEWTEARDLALLAIDLLADIAPALPAQFVVGRWAATRDCLWNIAALPEIFGDPTMWPLLYEANRHIMPRPGDPDLIHPGMVLYIPSRPGEFRQGTMIE
jgi:nucleoid-associated protein YgaU